MTDIKIDVVSTDTSDTDALKPAPSVDPNSSQISQYIKKDVSGAKWTEAEEKIVNSYRQKALGYKYLYNETFYHYNRYHNLIVIPLGILSVLVPGLQTVFTTLISTGLISNKIIFDIIMTVLTFVISTLVGLQLKFSPKVLAEACSKMARDFSALAEELNLLINLPQEMRKNPITVISTIQANYYKLARDETVTIPEYIVDAYVAKYQNKVELVDIADELGDFSSMKDKFNRTFKKNNLRRNNF